MMQMMMTQSQSGMQMLNGNALKGEPKEGGGFLEMLSTTLSKHGEAKVDEQTSESDMLMQLFAELDVEDGEALLESLEEAFSFDREVVSEELFQDGQFNVEALQSFFSEQLSELSEAAIQQLEEGLQKLQSDGFSAEDEAALLASLEELAGDDGYFDASWLETEEVQQLLNALPEEEAETLTKLIEEEAPVEALLNDEGSSLLQFSGLSVFAEQSEAEEFPEESIEEALTKLEAQAKQDADTSEQKEALEALADAGFLQFDTSSSQAQQLFSSSALTSANLQRSLGLERFANQRQDGNAKPAETARSGGERTVANGSQYMQELMNQAAQRMEQNVGSSAGAFFQSGDTQQSLSNTQQLSIHLGEARSTEAQQKQFLRQFENAMQRSQFTQNGGNQQLSIKLYPESLGRLDIQLTRTTEGMTARLMTSSQAARDLVESQLNQLRQAFQQQNINVDRIEVQQPYSQTPQDEQDGRKQQEQQREQSRMPVDEEELEETIDFDELLDELTFEEKV